LAASLRVNELDSKLLYVTPRQTALWREVFLKHSPIHGNPEFARIYREAYGHTADCLVGGEVHLVGLGCGTGLKEAELSRCLRASGRVVEFSAIDVSRDLVEEAARHVAETGAGAERHLVCDLAEIDFLKQWLDSAGRAAPRLFTFFGLVPNLEPGSVVRLCREIVRPGDVLLVSVHLAPVSEGVDLASAMKRILPQYDNAETLAWLQAARDELRLREVIGEPRVVLGEHGSIPCLRGVAVWKSRAILEDEFVLFQSLRYTPARFEELLRGQGLAVECLAITACREEGIWAVRVAEAVR
jgi:SAM-dependent methyltransferase